jgi:hypothetical protein
VLSDLEFRTVTSHEPTPEFGVTEPSRKAITLATSELLSAIAGLREHHRVEAEALPSAAGDVVRAREQATGAAEHDWTQEAARLEEIAADLRSRRHYLLGRLEPMWDSLMNLAAEAHMLLPAEAHRLYPSPRYQMEPAPEPIKGIEDGLTLAEWARILTLTVAWSTRWTEILVTDALGPCYALSTLIEHPTPGALGLRRQLEQSRDALKRLLLRDYA